MSYLTGLSDPQVYTDRLLAQHGKLAFDVGANAGWVASLLNFDKVVAFEPAEESFAALCARTSADPKIKPVCAALTDHEGTVRLRETEVTGRWGELVTGDTMPDWGPQTGWREVVATTLDTCAGIWDYPELVKIDVEGHEVSVLDGATRTIAKRQTQWFIEVHGAVYEQPLRDRLDGYTIEIVRNPQYTPDHEGYLRHFYMIGTPE